MRLTREEAQVPQGVSLFGPACTIGAEGMAPRSAEWLGRLWAGIIASASSVDALERFHTHKQTNDNYAAVKILVLLVVTE